MTVVANNKIDETCFWVLRMERETWIEDSSLLMLTLERVSGGSL